MAKQQNNTFDKHTMRTPIGSWQYVNLNYPDTGMDGDPKYTITQVLDPENEEDAEFMAVLQEKFDEMVEAYKDQNKRDSRRGSAKIFKDHYVPGPDACEEDADWQPTGKYVFTARTLTEFTSKKTGKVYPNNFPMWDSQGARINYPDRTEIAIRRGSKGRFEFEFYPKVISGEFKIVSVLQSVQVVELASNDFSGDNRQCGFGAVDGGFTYEFADNDNNSRKDVGNYDGYDEDDSEAYQDEEDTPTQF